MCGIAGLWARDAVPPEAVHAMADRLVHRGPDSGAVWTDAGAGIGLGHRRLAVIDLSQAGAQPMHSACGRFVIVFNGEIYNHAELRARLDAEARTEWRGHSDTETLLELVSRKGLAAALADCVGAFALALWDRRERRLALARDRMGEKPLYYGWHAGRVLFGSELKALRGAPRFDAAPDPRVLSLYLRHNQVPAPWSILQGVYKVPAGSVVTLDAAALAHAPDQPPQPGHASPGMTCTAYWSLAEVVSRPPAAASEEEALARIEAALDEAVRLQMVADVPVGAFLSGGIDSSLITALMCRLSPEKVKTFTIGFEQAGFDEAPYARAVARHLGAEHVELYLSPAAVRTEIPALPDVYDEPFADSSQLPTMLVSRLARQSVTVALSGDAGDELFCGYNRYLVSRRVWDRLAGVPLPLRRAVAAAMAALPPAAWDRLGRLPLLPQVPMLGAKAGKVARMLSGPLDPRAIYRASSEEWYGALPLHGGEVLASPVDLLEPGRGSAEEQMMQWDMAGYLADDILVKVDRASMASSLEVRVPLLDHRVIEAAWSLPLAFRKRAGQGKWPLRRLLSRHVPDALIDRPKAGFAVPVGAWLRTDLRDWAEDLLSTEALGAIPELDAKAIRRRWAQHSAGSHDWTGSMWGVLMLQAWQRRWSGAC
ncbi:MAG: asparagine synthase (glutamine-hydrolyzing) [Sphingomonadales bacterium]|nr:asparagine synthase (glutamine-hydrolyzing) [Sphingomonadales bacterium]